MAATTIAAHERRPQPRPRRTRVRRALRTRARVSADADTGKLAIALGLILGFVLIEVVIGVLAHSLALLSDAGHMLTDAAAIAFSLVAMKLAARLKAPSSTSSLTCTRSSEPRSPPA